MKAYLIITGSLFGFVALLHLLKAIDERHQLSTQPVYFISMAALGVVAGALAVWAFRLIRRMNHT